MILSNKLQNKKIPHHQKCFQVKLTYRKKLFVCLMVFNATSEQYFSYIVAIILRSNTLSCLRSNQSFLFFHNASCLVGNNKYQFNGTGFYVPTWDSTHDLPRSRRTRYLNCQIWSRFNTITRVECKWSI
jgi:hypothetical protein